MSFSMCTARLIGCITLGLCMSATASAQQSWIWSRDDNSRPINLATDSISIVLLESRVPSGDNFLANDSQVGLLIDAKFGGSTADEPQANRDFPFMFEETADASKDPGHPDSKNLSNQQVLVDYFPLSDGKTVYRSISISVTMLRKQDPAVWTKVLDTFLTATKDVTLPSPLTVGVNYLSKFSTDVLHQYLPDPNKDKRIDLGTFSFLLSSSSAQLNRVTSSGLHLRVLQPTGSGPGWVDPNRLDSYCFYTKFTGSNWTVWVSGKDPSAPDKDLVGCPTSKYTQLMNDYIPILIEAEQTPPATNNILHYVEEYGFGTGDAAVDKFQTRAEDMRQAALAQCKSFSLPSSKCPAKRGITR